MPTVSRLLYALVAALTTLFTARTALHLFQLESYQYQGYWRSFKARAVDAVLPGAISAAVNTLLLGFLTWMINTLASRSGADIPLWTDLLWLVGVSVVCCAIAYFILQIIKKKPQKKAYVVTDRVKRQMKAFAATTFCAALLVSFIPGLVAVPLVFPIFGFALLPLAAALIKPTEDKINQGFVDDAKRILLERTDLIKIGITGSFGKTSTKFFLAKILSEKFNVLATQGNFNVPLGVTRVVREQLMPEHQVFISEMGARHTGEIKELCELVRPKYGILTSVGNQHLETFKSQENITNTKYELAESLPADGAIVFASDNGGIVDGLYEKTNKPKKYLSGSDKPNIGAKANNLENGVWGSKFELELPDGKKKVCETKLLGSHNIGNLLAASTLAFELGLTIDEIASGISKVESVEHRLQIIDTHGGATVIDDAYNANPVGVRAALDVLSKFPKRRVIVTPGMVELGEAQERENKAFGEYMKDRADEVIIVGSTNADAISAGLKEAGFAEPSVHNARNLDEAQEIIKKLGVHKGETILFENDLPENYRE
ncbi:MAG: UDP-N-acetylmuramoyl-tripeptide--D-alanyl-D-alanine ligase [Oscillospiraceae bacterium]|jgi:UDP-N-acetylmuramoyl-tripeptide--D-alanyl-D-alanine ligase|nr:UDP-N-acetylmuramoyl-tripeptide--D-alanyl-D-alanine ligase [Oscillospiraceae bacterium]